MEEKENVDQSVLANDISDKIEYDFIDMFLVKPLDVVKVTKSFMKPVSEKKATVDENNVEAVDYDTVETEVKEVDSDFRKGIVLKIPHTYSSDTNANGNLPKINIGDVVVFRERSGWHFDLLKDSKLIKYYDIIAVVK